MSYTFPGASGRADGPAPFTAWAPAQYLDVRAYLAPRTFGGRAGDIMYPVLLDHDSPCSLRRAPGAGGARPGRQRQH